MLLPLIATPSTGCASGDAVPLTMASSHGRSMPSDAMCLRKSSTVLSDGMRVSLNGSGINFYRKNTGKLFRAIKKRQVIFAARFAQNQQRQFAQMVIAPHGTLAVRHFLSGRDVIPSVRAMINRVQQ